MPRADEPFEVLEKINDNAYKINLLGEYGVSCTFNVADLSPYFEDDHLENLRSNSLQQGEDDAPMEDQEGEQVEHPLKSKEVQHLLLTIGELQGESGLLTLGLASRSNHLVTLIT